jgi:ATP-dependent RNA helicase DHX57
MMTIFQEHGHRHSIGGREGTKKKMEEGGRRKEEEGGRRKEEGGRRKEEGGRRKEEGGRRKKRRKEKGEEEGGETYYMMAISFKNMATGTPSEVWSLLTATTSELKVARHT